MPPIPPQLHFPSPYLRPSSAPSIARSIEMADGARIASFVYGARTDATPVLFLHGNGEEHGIFGPAIDVCVEAGHHVVAIDSRGQGKSTLGSTRLTYELMADDALAVLDELGIRRVHIVGFSDGAIEALLIARDHPERVASVLSVGANLTPEGVLEEPDWNLAENVAQLRDWADAGWDSNGGIDPSLLSPTPDEASAAADLLELMLLEPHIPAESLAAISCPATVMVGEFDCIRDDETVVQMHPREADYVHGVGFDTNILHLWRPVGGAWSMLEKSSPLSWMTCVGWLSSLKTYSKWFS